MAMLPYNQLLYVPYRIYECRFGSHVYGTQVEDSDEDRRGIFVAPRAEVEAGLGIDLQINGPGDRELHELSRFLRLCAGQNPGFVELLWVPDDFVFHLAPAGQLLRAQRTDLLSARIGGAFTGLARAMLATLKKRRAKWVAVGSIAGSGRNERNRSLEMSVGYDAKTVATVIRLLRMAREALEDGTLQLVRPDAAELVAIRQGSLSFEAAVDAIEGEIAAVAAAQATTALPRAVDEEWLDQLLRRVQGAAWAAMAERSA